jgi:hypothetical protein
LESEQEEEEEATELAELCGSTGADRFMMGKLNMSKVSLIIKRCKHK